MSAAEPRLNASAKFFTASEMRKLRGCEQVAAVCYRIGRRGIEFLLVQTRNGRWTFPKGGVEPGLSHAQAAALEAYEEAGVHGRMEQVPFAHYIRRKGRTPRNIVVHAHLCEVRRLSRPQESNRQPTWFSAENSKRRLRENRKPDFATELETVVDRAVSRIRRLSAGIDGNEPLQCVQFEPVNAMNIGSGVLQASFARFTHREQGDLRDSAAMALSVNAGLSKLLKLGASPDRRLLTSGQEERHSKSAVLDAPGPAMDGARLRKQHPTRKRSRNR